VPFPKDYSAPFIYTLLQAVLRKNIEQMEESDKIEGAKLFRIVLVLPLHLLATVHF
jgi:hypothetical protein